MNDAPTPAFGCPACRALPGPGAFPVLEREQKLHDTEREVFYLERCRTCGQGYLSHYKEVSFFGCDDDVWRGWAPVAEGAVTPQVRSTPKQERARKLAGLVRQGPRLIRDPKGGYRWLEPWGTSGMDWFPARLV